MTTFATASVIQGTNYVQAADPVVLQTRLNALFAAFAANPNLRIASITLAGAGDGHTFVVELVRVLVTDIIGGVGLDPAQLTATCYMAADAFELSAQRNKVTPATPIGDEQLAGASQGTRFMGLILGGATFIEGGLGQEFSVVMRNHTAPNVVTAATTEDLTFTGGSPTVQVAGVTDVVYVTFAFARGNAAAGGTGVYVITVDGAPVGSSYTGTGVGVDSVAGGDRLTGIAAGPHTFGVEVTAAVGDETVGPGYIMVQARGITSTP